MSNRKGMSTILGTLIFIGILFSAVAPMFLMMRQADVFYEITKHEREAEDLNREQEDLLVYGYGDDENNTKLTVYIRNKGSNTIEIVRVWFNDDIEPVSASISPSNFTRIEFNRSGTSSERLKVTTSKGNIFHCSLGVLSWNGSNGWHTPSFGIAVHILNEKGQFNIIIEDNTYTKIYEYISLGMDDGDIDKTFLVDSIVSD
ncbi:hypothetical protein E4H04_12865, partial [Candidatus Bathyarchaeota archaeon]